MNSTLELHASNETDPADQPGPMTTDSRIAHPVRRLRTRTSRFGRYVDGALVIALLAPPALIALLIALGLQFALAVCVMFVSVFIITTAEDAQWIWRRHTDHEYQWDLD